jgi:hypothetical protein
LKGPDGPDSLGHDDKNFLRAEINIFLGRGAYLELKFLNCKYSGVGMQLCFGVPIDTRGFGYIFPNWKTTNLYLFVKAYNLANITLIHTRVALHMSMNGNCN